MGGVPGLGGRVSAPGGVSAPRGCLVRGCLLRGVCLVWGVSAPRGMSAPRGVPGPGGCLVWGGTWSGGGLVWGGAWSRGVSQHALRQTPLPPVDRHTLVKILPWPNFLAAGNKCQMSSISSIISELALTFDMRSLIICDYCVMIT